jgi:hypothetical protein
VERPSRHAMLGVRNGEIVGDRGGREDVGAPFLEAMRLQRWTTEDEIARRGIG